MPYDFPACSTVYHYFRLWRDAGVIKQMNHTLVEQVRCQAGHQAQPTGGSMDSQSAKTTEKGGSEALMGASSSTVASATS
ncbi:MAG: transposase [Synechococcaceae cyanobacterium SM2_3_2]|nr:transposase [Synechococcaceae cyanobacterium SM2_3_2]